MAAQIIVGAVIAAAGAIFAAILGSSDSDDARKEASDLAERKRQTDLRIQASQERMAELQLQQRKRESRMQARAESKRLKQTEKEFASTERTEFFNKQMGMLNSSEVMRSNFANNFRRVA